MQILDVHLPQFKNLHNFRVSFDQVSPVSVLVGRNGSGKSNLLEALTIIFRDLDLGQATDFEYRLRYECADNLVEVQNRIVDGAPELKGWVNDTPTRVHGVAGAPYRPRHVFGYYSGPSNRLEEHFRQHQERFYRALIRGVESPLRPLFYARNVHSNFVLLSFFLEDDPRVWELLREHLGITSFDSVLFVLQKPSWSSKIGDSRFWFARGTVQRLLDRLYGLALAPLRIAVSVPTGLSSRRRTEHLYLYLPSLEEAQALSGDYASNQEFFKALESTYISELIADVRIRVKIQGSDQTLTFRELSEGEQQLLLVLGLMRFTSEQESLFLLDEPDTHLNPAWSVQYRSFLYSFGSLDKHSHVVMATHDPLVVAGLTRSEVRVFDSTTPGQVVAVEPADDPQGMGVGALLTSDVYGLRSQLDIETLVKVDRKRELAAKPILTRSEEEELDVLSVQLRDIGLLAEDRDPEFQQFLVAKQERRATDRGKITLSSEEIEQNRAVAAEILDELRESAPDGG